MLNVDNLAKRFGGVLAVQGVSFTVEAGAIHGLIGPNGAGKTTLLNLMTGVLRPDGGRVFLDGGRVDSRTPEFVARAGIARSFQNIRLFRSLTALENVTIALTGRHNPLSNWRLPKAGRALLETEATGLLERVGLKDVIRHRAGDLAYGHQRRLELARALAIGPKLLLLDEPSAGMTPEESLDLMQVIRNLRREGLTILLVDHNMPLIMNVCDTITVLNFGKVIAQGTPDAVRQDPATLEAYLGGTEL